MEEEPTSTPNTSAPEINPTSLFPINSDTTVVTTATTSQWLSSSSFTTDLSVINDTVAALQTSKNTDDTDDEDLAKRASPILTKPSSTSYELLESSESDRNGGGAEFEPFAYGGRKSGVRAWENSDTKPSKDYYIDIRGDRDNLAFGCLYRMDIGQYKLHDTTKTSMIDFKRHSRPSDWGFLTRGELDADGLDSKLKSSGRYWSAKHSVFEQHRNFKRIRIVAPAKHVYVTCDDFIPFLDEDDDDSLHSSASVIVESWEDEVLRKTREFNKMTREHPHNVKVWLDFAEFQDKIASKQPQKGARLQTFEKKISILEKAVELNPEDEDLLLCLLKAYQKRDSADVFIGRWEKVLMQHSGSCKLWREFLRAVQGDFSTFKVSEIRKMYAYAIQALYATSRNRKKHRQVCSIADLSSSETVDTDLELGIVDIFLSLCRFEWQAGYHELATALLQAEIEYSLFYPPLQLTEQSKKRLFEHFWTSNGARVGEDGALGWCTWLENEEETRQKLLRETSAKEDKQAGWSGWFVPPSKAKENSPNLEDVNTDMAVEEVEEPKDDMDANQEEDDTSLLRMLGIDVDTEANREVHDIKTWVRWSQEELSRDHDQWMPIRLNSGDSNCKEVIEEEQEQLSRVILFEDVSDYLFSLTSPDAQLSLVLQFIDFVGGEISHWFCTNSSYWNEKILSLETLPSSILQYLGRVNGTKILESDPSALNMESLLNRSEAVERAEIMRFLRNAALLCLKVFPRNYKIEEAILIAEEQTAVAINSSQCSTMPSRALAKHLLKSDRQDVLLCGVYARREAAYGNIDHARRVFDMALSSISGLPLETQSIDAPLLYLWYSEMELADEFGGESESTQRALHILSCLGSGVAYASYKSRPSSTQLLRAHQGYKERLNTIRASWAKHVIDEGSIALICSAALFKELTAGWAAGVAVISDALSMVLPGTDSSFTLCCS
uniref:Uncharacterized protein n=1 Tax=Chenopodium quinoa TaxID=63459 RepID=A0A803MRW7_CHEQI